MLEIKDIYSDDFSKKFPLRYYPRSMTIRSKRHFNTPARIVTATEYNSKKNFPNDTTLEDHISIMTQYFNSTDLKSFLNENGAMKVLADKVSAFGKPSTDSLISFLSLRPYKDKWPPLKEDQFTRFMRFLGRAEASLPTRSLPAVPLEFEYSKAYTHFCRQNEDIDKIIWLNIEEQDPKIFRKKIDVLKGLVDNGWLNVVGFFAGHLSTVDKYNVNLDNVYTEFKNSEVLLVYEGSYKSFTETYTGVSKLHYHPFEMFDAVSPYKHPRGGRSKKSNKDKIMGSTLLDEDDLLLKSLAKFDRDKLYPYSDYSNRSILDQAFQAIGQKEDPDIELVKRIANFSNVQQVMAGINAMADMSNEIRKGTTLDYLDEKADLEKTVRDKLVPSTYDLKEFFK